MNRLEADLEETVLTNDVLSKELRELNEHHEKEMERELKFRNALTDAHASQVYFTFSFFLSKALFVYV